MGWTFYNADHYTKSGRVDVKSECDSFYADGAYSKYNSKVLKSTVKGSVYYAAVELIDKVTKERKVFAAVTLTSLATMHGMNFGYKDMDETAGPYESKCPNSILDLLTPTDNEYALAWRERCRKFNSVKPLSALPIGTMIQYMLGNGETRRLIKRPAGYQFKRPFWYCPDDNTYSSPKHIPMDYEIIETAAV